MSRIMAALSGGRKGREKKLEQALYTRTGKPIHPSQKQQDSESLSQGDRSR